MWKTYKHKKLWWIINEWSNWYSRLKNNRALFYERELIENSDDWELQTEEKDWIEEIVKDCINCVINDDLDADILRQSIKKHMPKITKEELDTIMYDDDYWNMVFDVGIIKQLLKDKWLYKE